MGVGDRNRAFGGHMLRYSNLSMVVLLASIGLFIAPS
jgi:hypothetical protein